MQVSGHNVRHKHLPWIWVWTVALSRLALVGSLIMCLLLALSGGRVGQSYPAGQRTGARPCTDGERPSVATADPVAAVNPNAGNRVTAANDAGLESGAGVEGCVLLPTGIQPRDLVVRWAAADCDARGEVVGEVSVGGSGSFTIHYIPTAGAWLNVLGRDYPSFGDEMNLASIGKLVRPGARGVELTCIDVGPKLRVQLPELTAMGRPVRVMLADEHTGRRVDLRLAIDTALQSWSGLERRSYELFASGSSGCVALRGLRAAAGVIEAQLSPSRRVRGRFDLPDGFVAARIAIEMAMRVGVFAIVGVGDQETGTFRTIHIPNGPCRIRVRAESGDGRIAIGEVACAGDECSVRCVVQ